MKFDSEIGSISCSIGAVVSTGKQQFAYLLEQAEKELSRAKEAGCGIWSICDADDTQKNQ